MCPCPTNAPCETFDGWLLRDVDYIQAAWQQPGAEAIRALGYPAPAGKAASSFCSTSGEAQAGDEHDSCMSALQPQHLSFTGNSVPL